MNIYRFQINMNCIERGIKKMKDEKRKKLNPYVIDYLTHLITTNQNISIFEVSKYITPCVTNGVIYVDKNITWFVAKSLNLKYELISSLINTVNIPINKYEWTLNEDIWESSELREFIQVKMTSKLDRVETIKGELSSLYTEIEELEKLI